MPRLKKKKLINNFLRSSATILLIVWFFYPWISLSQHSKVIRSFLKWSEVDYRRPPKTKNRLQESIRLNELFAHTQVACKKMRKFSSDLDPFPMSICVDSGPIGLDYLSDKKRDATFRGKNRQQLRLFSITNSLDDLKVEKSIARQFRQSKIWIFASESAVFRRHWPEALRPSKKNSAKITAFSGELMLDKNAPSSSSEQNRGANSNSRRYTVGSLFAEIGQIDILKIDCLICSDAQHLPKLLQEIIEAKILARTAQLVLEVRLDSHSDEHFLYQWFLIVHDLFYRGRMALFNAIQFGDCGRSIEQCRYRLSFARIPLGGNVAYVAPSMGMGTPDEEFQRLFVYLTKTGLNASVCERFGWIQSLPQNDWEGLIKWWEAVFSWKFCLPQLFHRLNKADECKFYVFQLPSGDSSLPKLREEATESTPMIMGVIENRREILESFANEFCQIHIFDPDLPGDKEFPEKLWFLHKLGLSDGRKEETVPGVRQGTFWNLEPLGDIMKSFKHNSVNAVLLDLNGGEWDVFEDLLASGVLAERVGQIVVRMRLWYGEEYENYQRHFTFLLRLKDAGFELFSATFLSTNRGSNSGYCQFKQCLEVGWVNRRWGIR